MGAPADGKEKGLRLFGFPKNQRDRQTERAREKLRESRETTLRWWFDGGSWRFGGGSFHGRNVVVDLNSCSDDRRRGFAVQQHNLVAVNEIWEEYRKYYTPRLVCIHKFICAFSKLGDSRSAYNTLQYMVKATCPAAAVKVPWKQRRYASRLDIPIPSINEHSTSFGSRVAGDDSVDSVPRSSVSDAELKADTILSNCDNKFGENDCVFPTMPQEVSLQENQFCRENVVLNSSSEFQYGLMKPVICGSTNVSPVQWGLSEQLKKLLVLSFNNVIHACGQSEDCEMAESLLQQSSKAKTQNPKDWHRVKR
ncbi:Pentatricopeptide repeat-containing protein [Nymphaea thermarum]|nr:Pentatricopeptide repeat-containing protein [Nymphaea thermarum]